MNKKIKTNLILIVTIALMDVTLLGFDIYEYSNAHPNIQCGENEQHLLKGDITYLSNKSNPEDPAIGVWYKIILKNPREASLNNFYTGLWRQDGSTIELRFHGKNEMSKDNYTAVFYDVNSDGAVSTGDIVHIYGESMCNSTISFGVFGYIGIVEIDIHSVGGSGVL